MAVVLPVELVLALSGPDGAAVSGAAALLIAVWLLALRSVFAASRRSPLALGVPVASGLGTLAGLAAVSFAGPWLPAWELHPGHLLLVALGIFVLTTIFETVAARRFAGRGKVIVVGAGAGGAELVEQLAADPDAPYECAGIVDDVEADPDFATFAPTLGRVDDLAEIVWRERPDLVVLTSPNLRLRAFDRLLEAAAVGFRVVGLAEFYEHAFGRVPIRHLSPLWFMSVLHLYQRPYPRTTKRAFDVLVGVLALVLAAPLLVVTALLVRLSGPGPVLYRQMRIGEGGKPFRMLKFRTMVDRAEEPGIAIWAEESDPRVTRVGRILRQSRLDELPQLWNVLRGDMSIVGPRPERPEFLSLLERTVPFWNRRHLVKPGITGWAQVRRGYTADADSTAEKLSYDLYYVKHRSLLLDVAIVAKTAGTVVFGSGAR